MFSDRSRRAPLTYEIENHCTSPMLVEVNQGCQATLLTRAPRKKMPIDREKMLVLPFESAH